MTATNESGGSSLLPEIFYGVWWSSEVPRGWVGRGDEHCATFQAEPPLGALQVSSARKETGVVTDDDLREFAAERMARGRKLDQVKCGSFSGYSTKYTDAGTFWKEWWLRSLNLMIYVTYNVSEGYENLEEKSVDSILASLKPIRQT